jgi:hypothetical protein
VARAVKTYLAEAAKTGKTLKVRASRHKFHTTTSLACPDQQYAVPNGTVDHNGVLAVALLHDTMDKVGRAQGAGAGEGAGGVPAAATHRGGDAHSAAAVTPRPDKNHPLCLAASPSKVLEFDAAKHTMTVGAGMRLNQLLPEATKLNMSVMVGDQPQGSAANGQGPRAPRVQRALIPPSPPFTV